MAIATLKPLTGNDGPSIVTEACITMPRLGAWHATLILDSQKVPSGKVTLQAGTLTLNGTVNRAGIRRGMLNVRVVAGGDGLRKVAKPKHYVSPSLRLPLSELAAGAGEAISAASDSVALNAQLLAWTTVAAPTGAMVDGLVSLSAAGVGWRLLADGTIWVGGETWPDSKVTDYRVTDESPEDGHLTLAMDVPRLIPGTTVGGRRLDLVEHVITADKYRAKVWVAG